MAKAKSTKDSKAAETTAKGTVSAAKITGSCAVIAALIGSVFLYLKNSRSGERLTNQQATSSPETIQLSIQTGSNSPVSIADSFNRTTVNNFESRRVYLAPDPEIVQAMRTRMAAFRNAHPQTRVIVEVEANNQARREIGTFLGSTLQSEKLGGFNAAQYFGKAPGAAVTLFHGTNGQLLAREVATLFAGYLKSGAALKESKHYDTNTVCVFLNGSPTFSTNGVVTFE